MRILIVEDEFISRTLLQRTLSAYGENDIAVNGKEACDTFRLAVQQENRYDLVCLDIMMPEMNGQEALKEIRGIEKANRIQGTDRTKVIMTSALSDPKSVMNAIQGQCDGYLAKPIDISRLKSLIKEFELVD
jgi:two-component system, chemotaxis family, chemotaxis protein CheY